MKAILEFELPDDESAFRRACRAAEFANALNDIDEHLRSRLKYADLGAAATAELQAARNLLRELVPDVGEI